MKKNFLTIFIGILVLAGASTVTLLTPARFAQAADCKVTSAQFEPGLNSPDSVIEKFYANDIHPAVVITIKTENCANQGVFVSIVDGGGSNVVRPVPIPELANKEFIVPESNTFDIVMGAGETQCFDIPWHDCQYYLVAGIKPYSIDPTASGLYFSKEKSKGTLAYECDTTGAFDGCDDDWLFLSDTSVGGKTNEITLVGGATAVDPNSSCTDSSGMIIAGCYKVYDGIAKIFERAGSKFSVITDANSLGGFLNGLIAVTIGIMGVLAVLMIAYQGFMFWQDRKDGNPEKMADTRSRILNIVGAFLLLLLIYPILRTINPELLNLVPQIDTVNFKTGGDTSAPVTAQAAANLKQNAAKYGISCPGTGGQAALASIASSFEGKVTYQYGAKGTTDGNTIYLDCSGFVSAVYACAGLPSPGGGTFGIFSGAPAITSYSNTQINGQNLEAGDLIGWTAGSITKGSPEEAGHVIMYLGNGKSIESSSRGGTNGGVKIRDAGAYNDRLKFWKSL